MSSSLAHVQDMFFLSSHQKELWASPTSALSQWSLTFPSTIEIHRIEQTWATFVDTYPILRTLVSTNYGQEPVAVVMARLPNLPLSVDKPEAPRFLDLLAQGPAHLHVRTGDSRLIWTFSGILMDELCQNQLMRIFDQMLGDPNRQLPSDYVLPRVTAAHLCYLSERAEVNNTFPQTSLPFCPPDQGSGTYCTKVSLSVTPAELEQCANACQTHRDVVLLALWGLLLCRMTSSLGMSFSVLTTPKDLPQPYLGYGSYRTLLSMSLKGSPSFALLANQLDKELARLPKPSEAWPQAEGIFSIGAPYAEIGGKLELRAKQTPYVYSAGIKDDDSLFWYCHCDDQPTTIALIKSLGHAYNYLLSEAVSSPLGVATSYPLMDPEQRQQALDAWQSNDEDPPDVAHAFLTCAQQNVKALAMIHGQKTYTFGDLMIQACEVATFFRKGKSGAPVALALHHPCHQVIAMLGALIAGVTFLPLAPGQGSSRLATITADAQCEVLADEDIFDGIPAPCMSWQDLPHELSDIPTEMPASGAAYIIYTSGSTGHPKGVIVPRSGLANTLSWRQSAYGMKPGNRALQVMSFGFDGYLTSTLTPLISGAALVLPKHRDDPEEICRLLREQSISHLLIVPTHLRALSEILKPDDLWSLTHITLAGEAVTPTLLAHWENARITWVNEYGPTENSVASTAEWACSAREPISIGIPIDGCRVHIQDRWGQEQPPFGLGEIMLEGSGLARGYLGKPAATALAFTPASTTTGGRAYHSGDLGYRLPDGRVVYRRRLDEQVKRNGYRVQPEEIVRIICAHKSVVEAVVEQIINGMGQTCLWTWYTGEALETCVRQHCLENLPHYMIPDGFLRVDQLPLTSSGKCDFKALRALVGN